MKYILTLLFLFSVAAHADVKISELPSISNAQLQTVDVVPIVDVSAGATKKIAIGQLDLRYLSSTGALTILGSVASPVVVTAGAGVIPGTNQRQMIFVKSVGGAVDITANPQITPGTVVGQELRLKGGSDTDYIILEDSDGLALNGDWLGTDKATLNLTWDGVVWSEDGRK